MKHIVMIVISMWMLCVAIPVIAAPLELVTLQYPPYEYEENGELKGVVVDIVHEVFRRMQQPIRIRLFPWEQSLKMIEDGSVDAIFTAYKTPEREVFAEYSREVLIPQVVSLFVLHDSPITFGGNLNTLSHYDFGAVRKMSYGRAFDEAVKQGVITIKPSNLSATGEATIDKFLMKGFHILVSNKYGALSILKKKGVLDQVKELSPEVERIPSYMAFSRKRNLTAIRKQFDKILADMKQDGTYERILNSYFE